jgi:FkbM family methyltransferase
MLQAPSIEIDGFKYFTDAFDSLGLISNKGVFEPETLAALKKLTQPGFRVLDIGANIGFFSVQLSKWVGAEGIVLAIEPQTENFRLLESNVRANHLTNVHLHHAAVGNRDGTASLFLSNWNGGMHRLYESVCCTSDTESVRITTVDSIVANQQIDLIKIDIEGYEFFALEGAKNCLQKNPHIKIISEYCALSAIEAGASPLAMLRYLEGLGFQAFSLDNIPVDLNVLKAEAVKYEDYGSQRLVSECLGKTNPEILDIAVAVGLRLGCKRPVLESLLFSR